MLQTSTHGYMETHLIDFCAKTQQDSFPRWLCPPWNNLHVPQKNGGSRSEGLLVLKECVWSLHGKAGSFFSEPNPQLDIYPMFVPGQTFSCEGGKTVYLKAE